MQTGAQNLFTVIIGGKAGHGVKKAGSAVAAMMSSLGRFVFQMDDYQSLIRGGHNFSAVSSDVEPLTSHHLRANLVLAFDRRSYELHRAHVAPGGLLVGDLEAIPPGEGIALPLLAEAHKHPQPDLRLGVAAPAVLAAALGWSSEQLRELVAREYRRDQEINLAYAQAIYEAAWPHLSGRFSLATGQAKGKLIYGNEAIGLGAIAAGLDLYFAYPMTPSSSLLHFLASTGREFGVVALHVESELAAANMAVGATFAGARAMAGTSGGGFALMAEAFSLAGMMEAPVLFLLSSRSGPSTGVPTYTEQGDLYFALHQGHGEFPRIVASPGSIAEGFYLASELLSLAWQFQSPAILLADKHFSESASTVHLEPERAAWPQPLAHADGPYKRYLDTESGVSPLLHPPAEAVIKWNSYEHDELGITTDEAEMVARMHEKRLRKAESIRRHLQGRHTVNVYGNGGRVIFAYGSTTMSVLEALRVSGLEATLVQPIYLEPLPTWALAAYAGSDPIVVEQSASGQFARLLEERAGIRSRRHIRRYDGRPFEPSELASQIQRLL